MWLNINHITVHKNMYILKLKIIFTLFFHRLFVCLFTTNKKTLGKNNNKNVCLFTTNKKTLGKNNNKNVLKCYCIVKFVVERFLLYLFSSLSVANFF